MFLRKVPRTFLHCEKNAIESKAFLSKSMYIMDSNQYAIELVTYFDTHVLICRMPHLENFSGNDKNVLLAQINKCKQIFVFYVHKNA